MKKLTPLPTVLDNVANNEGLARKTTILAKALCDELHPTDIACIGEEQRTRLEEMLYDVRKRNELTLTEIAILAGSIRTRARRDCENCLADNCTARIVANSSHNS